MRSRKLITVMLCVLTAVGMFALPAEAEVSTLSIVSGPNPGSYPAGEYPWSEPSSEGSALWTVYGGTGCDGDVDVPRRSLYPSLDPVALVLVDGGCKDSEKIAAGQAAGYDAVIVASDHKGSRYGARPDAYRCAPPRPKFDVTVSAFCTGHQALHAIFNTEATFGRSETDDLPAYGAVGELIVLSGT